VPFIKLQIGLYVKIGIIVAPVKFEVKKRNKSKVVLWKEEIKIAAKNYSSIKSL